MGRATDNKDEQIKYIKHRLQLLNEVGQSLDESADVEDLNQLIQMLDKLMVKANVFLSDWENKRSSHINP